MQQQEQYDKIMNILEAHEEKISEIKMDCYKINHFIQYINEYYTPHSMTQQTLIKVEDKSNEGYYRQQHKEPKEKNQATIHLEVNMQ